MSKEEGLLFVNKKKQKNFIRLESGEALRARPRNERAERPNKSFFALLCSGENPKKARAVDRKRLLFVNKKKQKNFARLESGEAPVAPATRDFRALRAMDQQSREAPEGSFLLLFFKKEDLP